MTTSQKTSPFDRLAWGRRMAGAVGGIPVLAAFLLVSLAFAPRHLQSSVQTASIHAIACLGIAIALGFAGQFALGWGAVMAVGAYGSALLMTELNFSPIVSILLGTLIGTAFGGVLALPALRLRSHHLAMVTLGFAIVVPQLLLNWDGLTAGFRGVSGIDRPEGMGGEEMSRDTFKYVLAALLLLVTWWVRSFSRSGWRLAFLAVRGDELAAASVGLRIHRIKLLALLIASALVSLAGALYASDVGFISPDTFDLSLSLLLLAMVVLGGAVSVYGAILGALALVVLPQYLASIRDYEILLYGGVLLAAPLILPGGLVRLGSLISWRSATAPAVAAPVVITGSSEHPHAAADDLFGEPRLDERFVPLETRPVVLSARELTKAFGGVVAINGVDLELREGAVHALVGPNGSGKSTLVNLLSGLYPFDSGTIDVAGGGRFSRRVDRAAASGIARTFQTSRLFSDLSVIENVVVAGLGSSRSILSTGTARRGHVDDRAVAMRLLDEVRLSEFADAPVSSLTLGRRRLLELARVLALAPRVILLDEPAAGLARGELRELHEVVKRLGNEGVSILIVEHDQDFVLGLADHVYVLDQGTLLASGTPTEIRANEAVRTAYLGPQKVVNPT